MTYALYVNERFAADLATTTGWQDFIDWTDELSIEKYRDVIHLAEHGWTERIGPLAKQLAEAILESPPDKNTSSVARSILSQLSKLTDGQSVIVVSDGSTDLSDSDDLK